MITKKYRHWRIENIRPGQPRTDAKRGRRHGTDVAFLAIRGRGRLAAEDWAPPDVDTRRANVARVYDYLLGGDHNFLADQDVARTILAIEPRASDVAKASRAFLSRAVRFMAARGVTQFLDIGSGIPTQGNVHEIAQAANPSARVVYADVDPVAVAHSKAILAGNDHAAAIHADLRQPEKILADETVCQHIDFTQPVGLLLVAILHFLSDEDDPWRIVATLRDALAPGSYLVVAHATSEGRADAGQAMEKVYDKSVTAGWQMRPRSEIERIFRGLEIVEPGLVYSPLWRPDPPAAGPDGPTDFGFLVAVARKSAHSR